jgi:hypothetical protein
MRLRGGDRKYCIAGNWKMNPATLDEAKKLATEVLCFPSAPPTVPGRGAPPTARTQGAPALPRAAPVRASPRPDPMAPSIAHLRACCAHQAACGDAGVKSHAGIVWSDARMLLWCRL